MVDVNFWHIGGPVLFEKLTLNSFKYVRHPLLFRLWQKKRPASYLPRRTLHGPPSEAHGCLRCSYGPCPDVGLARLVASQYLNRVAMIV